jgi:autoinducer 2-degrading protein
MQTTLVHVRVDPRRVDDFIAETLANHVGSVAEPGNLRFDVLQSEDDPTRFVLVEVYATAEAAAEHKRTAHYLRWRDAVAPWMASPREGLRYRVLAPRDVARW